MRKCLVVLLATAFLCTTRSNADEKSARFYLNPDATRSGSAFLILIKNPSILEDLGISQDIRRKIAGISITEEGIQGSRKLAAEYTEKSRLAGSYEERSRLLSEYREKNREIMYRFSVIKINDLLSEKQKVRMKQLIYQFHGLSVLADKNTELDEAKLLPGQQSRIADLKKAHLSAVDVLFQSIKRNAMGEKFPDETGKIQLERTDSLLDFMSLTGKTMDRVIEGMLSKQQIEKWIEIRGKPLPVKWDYQKVMFSE